MNKIQAALISELLNDRGFVIDDDIKQLPVSYTKFASWVKENEELLRSEGYEGGELRGWSSGFRGNGCSYGVTDIDREISNEWIDNYCIITEALDGSNVTMEDLRKYKFVILYQCSCGHANLIAPEKFPACYNSRKVVEVTGFCTECSEHSISPKELRKPWIQT